MEGKTYTFRADPVALEGLVESGFDAVSLANNHTLDFEEQGLLDTLTHLDAAGIQHAGAGRNLDEARRPALLTPGPDRPRVALVAFTDNEPSFAAGPNRPGTAYLPVSLEPGGLETVEASIAAARDAGAEVVIFSNHWGPNMIERPSTLHRQFAHAVAERGVDIYFGHSAHLTQGVELYRDTLILYDTGDFIDDYAVDPFLRNDWSFLFLVSLEGRRVCRLELEPVELHYARVCRAVGHSREANLTRMENLSRELGTHLRREDDRLVLPT